MESLAKEWTKLKNSISEEFLSCSICLENFRDPRVLPCLHTFCADCLSQYIGKTAVDGVFACPHCREPAEVPANRGVEGFRQNFLMNNLTDSLMRYRINPEAKETLAEVQTMRDGEIHGEQRVIVRGDEDKEMLERKDINSSPNEPFDNSCNPLLFSPNFPLSDDSYCANTPKKVGSIVAANRKILRRIPSGDWPNSFSVDVLATYQIADCQLKGICWIGGTSANEIAVVNGMNAKVMIFRVVGGDSKGDERLECRLLIGGYYTPEDVDFLPGVGDEESRLVVTGGDCHSLKVYTLSGHCVEDSLLKDELNRAVGVAASQDGSHVAVTDSESRSVYVTDVNNGGELVYKLENGGSQGGCFEAPEYVTFDPNSHNLVVSDRVLHGVKVFSENGGFRFSFGILGDGECCLNSPEGVCVDRRGKIVVADVGNNRLVITNGEDGELLGHINCADIGFESAPHLLALGNDDVILVANESGTIKLIRYF